MTSRRWSALLVLVAIGLFAAPGLHAAEKVSVTHAVVSLAYISDYVAAAKGFYAEEGLDVTVIVTQGGGPDVQAVLAGEAQFTINDGPQTIPAIQEGKKILAVAGLLKRNIINVAMHTEVAKARGIKPDTPFADKVRALKGLTLATTRPGALTWHQANYLLKLGGMEPQRDATVIGAGGGPAILAALENRKADVIFISVPITDLAVHRGFATILINNATGEDPNLREFMMESLYVTPAYAEKNPQTVRRMVRALLKANRWVKEQPAATVADAIKGKFGGLPAPVLTAAVGLIQQGVVTDGMISEEAVKMTQDLLAQGGVLKQRFTRDALFTDRFLK
jgi:ABC-type nitrate/sulfonate/bicarbonate transport system substrate-binding protein